MPKQGEIIIDKKESAEPEPCIAIARFDPGRGYKLPTRTVEGDAGLDLYVSHYTVVYAHQKARLSHNIALALPHRFYGLIIGRSSTLISHGLIVLPGVIDQGFRGEVQTVVYNPGPATVVVNEGMRVSQLLIHRYHEFPFRELPVEDLLVDYPSARGDKGFGSSDPKKPKG